MKKAAWILLITTVGAVQTAHAVWRDKVVSLWPQGPVQIDGRATEWSELPVIEDGGISFRAMNDASSLYLLIRSTTNDGRVLLSGKYRQNLTLWILKLDHKSKAWGIDIDFSHAHPPEASSDTPRGSNGDPLPTLAAIGVVPEIVLPEGLEVSTQTWPQDIELQADLSTRIGRQPVYEIRVPLELIKERTGRSIYIDFVSSEISPEAKVDLQSGRSEQGNSENNGNGGNGSSSGIGGGRHRHSMGGSEGGKRVSTADLPKPLTLHLTVELAKRPK